MNQKLVEVFILIFLISFQSVIFAKPEKIEKYIMIDQFGYRPSDPKFAVIVNPQIGFNAADSFTVGPTLEVRRWDNDKIILSGSANVWNNGAVDFTSGDKGWWFDFSTVTAEGDYYIYDPENKTGSYQFKISEDIYREALKAAVHTFYYQRLNDPKIPHYAEEPWTDEAAFLGPGQDSEARYLYDKDNPATARDLSGGWMDAGDYNKYVTFAESVVHQLLTAYVQNPAAFTDDFNIPESGNGIPDIIDEVKYEMEWIKKMQDSDGGFFIKLGNTDWNVRTPPSQDKRPRFYGPKCSSSTIAGTAMLAHTALVFAQFAQFKSEIPDLKKRAIKAWDWFQSHPKCDTCDSQEIKSGDADIAIDRQVENEVVAAIYLFALTGDKNYHHIIKEKYVLTAPYYNNHLAFFFGHQFDALLYYTTLETADPGLKNLILAYRRLEGKHKEVFRFDPAFDLYRAYLPHDLYRWGSLNPRLSIGSANYDFITYNLNPENHQIYLNRALGMVHYLHGINPLGMVYLSNMYKLGAEKCIQHIWHDWFSHNSPYADNPPPGYLPGGPNAWYNGSLEMLKQQPIQKAYRDWNGSYPENSWEISEPAIYNQAAYIKLISRFVGN